MIRPAKPEDYQPISEMLADFHAAAGQAYTEFDPASAEKWVEHLATAPFGVVLVAEEGGQLAGAIAGVVVPVFVNAAQQMAQEGFMWVRPEARRAGTASALIGALEAWASVRGARTLTMVSWHGSDHEKVNALYAHLGYEPLEYHYIKKIKCLG
jgi:GNAT superfamily N-acetyltransferase